MIGPENPRKTDKYWQDRNSELISEKLELYRRIIKAEAQVEYLRKALQKAAMDSDHQGVQDFVEMVLDGTWGDL